ncbi:MAG: glycosyltransferase [Cyclobacteriaceae bacterium]
MKVEASLIIAFYNKVDFLSLVFAGLERQSNKKFEVVIADDGSNEESVAKLKDIIDNVSFRVIHVWHEDEGWRKNKILNEAVVKSTSDYLIFIDADCIAHRHFVHEHLLNKENNTILAGRRANLTSEKTQKLDYNKVKKGLLERSQIGLIVDGLRRQTQHAEKAIYIRSSYIRGIIQKKRIRILGCNFSIHKSDLLKLNGFDERYLAPTLGEDVDIELRARQAQINVKSVSNMAIQYHLYHKKLDRENDNILIFEDNKRNGITRTPYGISKEASQYGK